MAFGGFFGGGGGSGGDNNTSASSPSSSEAPSTTMFTTPSVSSSSPSNIKSQVQMALQTETAIANAKFLIKKINDTCFDHCITEPGSSLSGRDSQCLSSCMEKYIEGWNITSKTYVARLQKEGAQLNSMMGGGASGPGREMF